MKKILTILLLIIALVISTASFVGCDVNDSGNPPDNENTDVLPDENPEDGNIPDDGEGDKDEKPDEPTHTHAYEYELIPYNGGYALDGYCDTDGCDNPTLIIPVTPEYEYLAPTSCITAGESRWIYSHEGKIYVYSVSIPDEVGEHEYKDGSCIHCQAEEPENPSEPEHTHAWTDATCSTPMTCESCGATVGSAKGHSWSAATCTEPMTCSTCGEASGSANGHAWASATCTTPKTCSVCGETNGSSNGHTWVDATCTEPMTCSTCGEASGSAKGHSFSDGICIICTVLDPDYVAPGAHTHTDLNNDDKCDSCYETVVIVIDFYAINDLHGKFCDTSTQPGVDNLATYLKDRQYYDDNVIILSSGDMWQGAAESNLTNGKIITEWMNEMDFVSMTLGNHEYDWGEEAIRENLAVAEFPFLAINVYDKTTGKLADYCTPSVVVEMNGFRVGIIGAIGDCYSSISSDMSANVEFKVGSQLTALVKAESDRLRAQGVDLIVYSIHDGDSAYDTSLSNGYVDIVFEGHTHSQYIRTDSQGIYHLQGGGENGGITHAEIKYNFANDKKTVNQAEFISNSTYSSCEEDLATNAIEDKYSDVIDMAYTVIGRVSKTQSDSTLESIVAELYLKAGLEKWGNEYNIVLGGGFLLTRSPYSLAAGDVTYSDVLSLFPFDNQLVLCSISGTYLKSKFINTTNSDYYCSYSDYGNSIKNNVSSSTTYYVIVDTYTAYYSSNRLTVVDFYDENIFARDLLANEIKNGRFDTSSGSGNGSGSGSTDSYTLTSIPDILAIGKTLGTGKTTTESYYVKGTITSITQTTYGNMYIEDENGNKLLIYGLYDQSGNRYGNMSSKPQVGDTIIICGPIYRYDSSTIEIKNGTWITE